MLRTSRALAEVGLVQGVQAVSPNGVLGDPAGATADEGCRFLDLMVHDVSERLSHVHT